jgi:Sulfotransferase domain
MDRMKKDEQEPEEAREAAADRPRQRAIWIASYPKSGNTWVRVLIHNLIRELRGQHEGAQDINALHEITLRESLAPWFARRLGKSPHAATAREIADARTNVQADMVRGEGGPLYIKTHNAVAIVEGFPTVNFDVTLAAVYILRNPLDVAVSYARYSGLTIDRIIAYMADPSGGIDMSERRVYEFVGSWSFHVASWMAVPHRPVLLLRYEDMLATPERSFARLAAFLRLKPGPEQLRRAIEKSSFAELARQEEEHGFVERPNSSEKFFRVGKAGQWREALLQNQVNAIVSAHAPMMMRFGYLAEDSGGVAAP